MKYYLDCEFDGLGGPLLSMALVSHTGRSMYVIMDYAPIRDPWVNENVHPVMLEFPIGDPYPCILGASPAQLSQALEEFLKGDTDPQIIADWPDDIKYFCAALITGPGTMIDVWKIRCKVVRVDAYPSDLPNAVQHNAWWDAMALRRLMMKRN